MLCFHFNPISGKYGALIIGILRAAGVLTLVLVSAACSPTSSAAILCVPRCQPDHELSSPPWTFPIVPEQASSVAGQVDLLFWFLVLLTLRRAWPSSSGRWHFFLYKYRKGSPCRPHAGSISERG